MLVVEGSSALGAQLLDKNLAFVHFAVDEIDNVWQSGVLFLYLACVTASGPTLVPSPELNAAPMSMCIASSFDNPLWE